jgi:hypothetical protein
MRFPCDPRPWVQAHGSLEGGCGAVIEQATLQNFRGRNRMVVCSFPHVLQLKISTPLGRGSSIPLISSSSKRHRWPVPYSGTLPTDPLAPTYPKPAPGHSHGTSPLLSVPMALRGPSDARATELGVSLTVLECELGKFFSSCWHRP